MIDVNPGFVLSCRSGGGSLPVPLLLEAMVDALLAGVTSDLDERQPWHDQVAQLAHRLHEARLSRRDGARLFAGVFFPLPDALAYGEQLVSALRVGGLSSRDAAWSTDTITYYVVSHSTEEQLRNNSPPLCPIRPRAPHGSLARSVHDVTRSCSLRSTISLLRTRRSTSTSACVLSSAASAVPSGKQDHGRPVPTRGDPSTVAQAMRWPSATRHAPRASRPTRSRSAWCGAPCWRSDWQT
ncbi:Tetracyclin repressor-like [Frankia casuarinae]|uniref:Tetracyclin repressor-like n=2 Tax=Frankia TaxID=1854 RepID=Q2JGK1_FRACC|nr:Tetracyclin repressor-like [Frankia casuarinae]